MIFNTQSQNLLEIALSYTAFWYIFVRGFADFWKLTRNIQIEVTCISFNFVCSFWYGLSSALLIVYLEWLLCADSIFAPDGLYYFVWFYYLMA